MIRSRLFFELLAGVIEGWTARSIGPLPAGQKKRPSRQKATRPPKLQVSTDGGVTWFSPRTAPRSSGTQLVEATPVEPGCAGHTKGNPSEPVVPPAGRTSPT